MPTNPQPALIDSSVVIPTSFDDALAILKSSGLNYGQPATVLPRHARLCDDLFLCLNSKLTIQDSEGSTLPIDETISLVWAGAPILTFSQTGWVYFHPGHFYCFHLVFDLCNRVLRNSLFQFTCNFTWTSFSVPGWVLCHYAAVPNTHPLTRSSDLKNSYSLKSHIAIHPTGGRVNADPFIVSA